MRDMMGMMKAMGEMKAKAEALQNELETTLVEGRAGGGMVVVTLTGKGAMKGIRIDPSLLKPEEAEIVEDLITAAHADARTKSEAAMAEKTQALMGGLQLPPGMKLPF
jgi:nucleoid-associated protein EbfC